MDGKNATEAEMHTVHLSWTFVGWAHDLVPLMWRASAQNVLTTSENCCILRKCAVWACANFKGLEVITFYVQGYEPRLKKSTETDNPFLGAFATFRKATISFVMSACLCPHGRTRLPLDGYSGNVIFKYFFKICLEKTFFYILLTVPLSIILTIDQLNVQILVF